MFEQPLAFARQWFADWGGKLTLAFAGILLLHLAYVTFHFGGDEWASLISNLISPVIYAGPGILAWRVSLDETLTKRRRIAWRLISLATFSFMLGDVIWLVLENGLGLQPFPSVADVGYLLFYPLMLGGLLCSVERFSSREEMVNFWLDASVVVVAGGMVLWRMLVQPMVASSDADQLKTILSAAYPVGDLVLLLGISSLMLRRSDFHSQAPVNFVLVGVVVNFVADFAFGYQSLHGLYQTGAPIDALFTLACFPVMLGAHLEKLHAARRTGSLNARKDRTGERYFWLPYIALGVVYLVLLQMIAERAEADLDRMFLLAGVVTVLVIVRQFMFVRESTIANATLNSLQRRIQGIYSASSDAIGLATFDGTLTEVNESFINLTGYERHELVGKMSYQDFVPDESLEITIEPSSFNHHDDRERELIRKDGSTRSVTAMVYAVDDGETGPSALAVVVRDVTLRRELQRKLSYQARHDSLTGLANRSMLHERVSAALSRARRRSTGVALLFIDLDNFKTVNDTMGHAAGDELLTVIAKRLRSCLRASDSAARLGGDEFAILLEDLSVEAEPATVADRLIDIIRKPVEIAGKDVFVGASIGIATGDLALASDELLRNADVAMYTAKREGKNRFSIFQPQMQQAVMGRAKLEVDLRTAVEKNQFEVKYQPIIDLATNQPVAVEALVRWRHPDGEIAPNTFIPIAEEINLISGVGQLVLDTACDQVARWNSDLRFSGRLAVSVNVSSRQLSDENFVTRLIETCDRVDLPTTELILEITESAMLSNAESTMRHLEKLRSLGVRIAIDDFGTGYSSLSYLHRFPIDILKIDRSFIEKVTDCDKGAAMVRAIVSMSRTLGLDTVAEGIENPGQVEVLRAMGCERGQGFNYSKPLSAGELLEYLKRHFTLHDDASASIPLRGSVFGAIQPTI